jgi:putative transposase
MHNGWRSRGYLPHCDERGLVQHIVFGLHDGFRAPPPAIKDSAERALWADKEFDVGHGSRLLSQPRHAQTIQERLLHSDGERYALAAWCIMPTHVHVVVEQFEGAPLSDIVQQWKSVSAHAINKVEGRTGALWQREYFDRFMRSSEQFGWTVAYVENNPVAARLVERPQDWDFSSATWRRNDAGEGAGAP